MGMESNIRRSGSDGQPGSNPAIGARNTGVSLSAESGIPRGRERTGSGTRRLGVSPDAQDAVESALAELRPRTTTEPTRGSEHLGIHFVGTKPSDGEIHRGDVSQADRENFMRERFGKGTAVTQPATDIVEPPTIKSTIIQIKERPTELSLGHPDSSIETPIKGMQWEKSDHVGLWLPRQYRPATKGIDCIDDREVADPRKEITPLGSMALNEGIFLDSSYVEVPQRVGDLNFPGEDFGIATTIRMTTRVDPAQAVFLAQGFAKSLGRNMTIHTDTKNVLTDPEKGCGMMSMVVHSPELFDLDALTGRKLADYALSIPTKEGGKVNISTYQGAHNASAWVESYVTTGSFKQTSPEGNVFLTEPGRVEQMFTNPDQGLVAFLKSQGVKVDPESLTEAYNHIIDVIRPKLASGIPMHTITPMQGDNYLVTSNGIIK